MSKKKHDAHHGGAWKVAYADFVTAMMALFMVLWIVGQKEDIVQATASYFKNPLGTKYNDSIGNEKLLGEGGLEDKAADSERVDKAMLQKLAEEIYKTLKIEQNDKNRTIDIFVTQDGLKILIYNLENRLFWNDNEPVLSNYGDMIIQSLAWLLDRRSRSISITSYDPAISKLVERNNKFTLRQPNEINKMFSAWSLSSLRANSIYQKLVYYGFSLDKLSFVTTKFELPSEARYFTEIIELLLKI